MQVLSVVGFPAQNDDGHIFAGKLQTSLRGMQVKVDYPRVSVMPAANILHH